MDDLELTNTQKKALELMRTDLNFLYSLTIHFQAGHLNASYFVALLPYIGVICEGIFQWTGKVFKDKDAIFEFSPEEADYYKILRNNIKFWNEDFTHLIPLLESKYQDSKYHFSNVCKPLAKHLNLYDIFGCFLINDSFCGNTIMDSIVTPYFEWSNNNGEYVRSMSIALGRLFVVFQIDKCLTIKFNPNTQFATEDYCGFKPSPINKREFSDKFVLFTLLSNINFILNGIEEFVEDDIPTKFRLSYLQYFYICNLVPKVNNHFHVNFTINTAYVNNKVRNSLAHYGLGSVLSNDEIIMADAFGGLTNKYLGLNWIKVHSLSIQELKSISKQLEVYLKI